jgi:hypothetical protein
MPEPREGEDHDEWIERCMSDPEQQESFPDPDQRLAVCESKWQQKQEDEAGAARLPDVAKECAASVDAALAEARKEAGLK